MNKQEKELAKLDLEREARMLRDTQEAYRDALSRVYERIDALADRDDLSGIRQRKWQETLAEQIGGALDDLRGGHYGTMEQYLEGCYEDGFVGALYSLQKQGVPLAFPIDQRSLAKAVGMTAGDVKLSKRVYSNVDKLQRRVIGEISRGFADSSHVARIAENLASSSDVADNIKRNVKGVCTQSMSRAMTIARTEKGRVQSESQLDAMARAKAAGADVVKQWDSTLDSRTRKDHRKLDGQIRELDEPFEVGGRKAMAPRKFGRAEQDINCRCTMLQRSRAALDIPENEKYAKWDGEGHCFADLSDAETFSEFKTAYKIKVAEKDVDLIGKRLARYNKQAASLEGKSYKGIWRDDVTVKDYEAKAASIAKKREYFAEHMGDDEEKFKGLSSLLADFEKDGKQYAKIEAKRAAARAELKARKRELAELNGYDFAVDPFSPERKEAAHSFESAKKADGVLRPVAEKVWKSIGEDHKRALFDYTRGSGKFNRPLAGFMKPWSEPGSGFEEKYFKGPGKVWIDYEGCGAAIRRMTEAIEKSKYDSDIWLNRGCGFDAMESFFGIGRGELGGMSDGELQKLVGTTNTMTNFISTGVADGTGFTGRDVTMRIYAPEGTEMMYAEPFSHYGNGAGLGWDGESKQSSFGSEAEMIIQRGASYTVTSIERRGGKLYVELEVHPEIGYDKFQQDGKWSGSKEKFK